MDTHTLLHPWRPFGRTDAEDGVHPYLSPSDNRAPDPAHALVVQPLQPTWKEHLLHAALKATGQDAHAYFPAERGGGQAGSDYAHLPRVFGIDVETVLHGTRWNLTDVPRPQDGRALLAGRLTLRLHLDPGGGKPTTTRDLPCPFAFAGNLDEFANELGDIVPVFLQHAPRPDLADLANAVMGGLYRYRSDWADDSEDTDSLRFYKDTLAWCLGHLTNSDAPDPGRHAVLEAEIKDSLGWLSAAPDAYVISINGHRVAFHTVPESA